MTAQVAKCENKKCGSLNIVRVNPLGKIALIYCKQCGRFFIPWEDRLKVCIQIGLEKPALQLFNTGGTINERVLRFWARTDTKGTAAIFLKYIEEHDAEFFRRMTPATTIDRDFRRNSDDNADGLNKTYRKEAAKRPTSLENYMT